MTLYSLVVNYAVMMSNFANSWKCEKGTYVLNVVGIIKRIVERGSDV